MEIVCKGAFQFEDADGVTEAIDAVHDLLGELPAPFRRAWSRAFLRADGPRLRFDVAVEGPEAWIELLEQVVQEAGDDALGGRVELVAGGQRYAIEADG